jgi:hypothetical protein
VAKRTAAKRPVGDGGLMQHPEQRQGLSQGQGLSCKRTPKAGLSLGKVEGRSDWGRDGNHLE